MGCIIVLVLLPHIHTIREWRCTLAQSTWMLRTTAAAFAAVNSMIWVSKAAMLAAISCTRTREQRAHESENLHLERSCLRASHLLTLQLCFRISLCLRSSCSFLFLPSRAKRSVSKLCGTTVSTTCYTSVEQLLHPSGAAARQRLERLDLAVLARSCCFDWVFGRNYWLPTLPMRPQKPAV